MRDSIAGLVSCPSSQMLCFVEALVRLVSLSDAMASLQLVYLLRREKGRGDKEREREKKVIKVMLLCHHALCSLKKNWKLWDMEEPCLNAVSLPRVYGDTLWVTISVFGVWAVPCCHWCQLKTKRVTTLWVYMAGSLGLNSEWQSSQHGGWLHDQL